MTVNARFTPNLDLRHPGFRLFLRLTIPIMLALSLSFTDDWIVRWFGSFLQPASITWLSYGKKLMQVPLGVVGQGVGVASFPFLAQLYSEGKFDELNRLLDSTMKGVIALLVPISALTMALSAPVVYLAFWHSRMTPSDLDATAATLVFFSLGLFAWGAQNILARSFYATRNTIIPAIVGTAVTFGSLPVYWLLVRRINYLGLALASTLGITVYTVVLYILLNRRTKNRRVGETMLFFLKVCAASAVAGSVCHSLMLYLQTYLPRDRFTSDLLLLVIVTSVGVLLLVALGKLLRIRELDEQIGRLWTLASSGWSKISA